MNRDSEELQQHLLWLVQDLLPWTASGSTIPSPNRDFLLELGDIPTVQDRFQALLKQRLQSEIQQNLPLFPWETEIHDYESERVTPMATDSAIAANSGVQPSPTQRPALVWLRQLGTMNLPVPVPDTILAQLLERCQGLMQASLREGTKLVRAVEDLFPGEDQSLNYLAGLVMTSPARSGQVNTDERPETSSNFPSSYEAAVPAQQMVLSLLAAQAILNTLTITVSRETPIVDRQWLTEVGALSLQVSYEYHPEHSRLRIQTTLPRSGCLTVVGPDHTQTNASRPTAGDLGVELLGIQPQQSANVSVELTELGQAPLNFLIQVTDA